MTETMDSLVMEPHDAAPLDPSSPVLDETTNNTGDKDAESAEEEDEELEMDFSIPPPQTETTFSRLTKNSEGGTSVRKRRGFGRVLQTSTLEELTAGLNEPAILETTISHENDGDEGVDDNEDDSLSDPKRISLDSGVFSSDDDDEDEAISRVPKENLQNEAIMNEFQDSDDDEDDANTDDSVGKESGNNEAIDTSKPIRDDDDNTDKDSASESKSAPVEEKITSKATEIPLERPSKKNSDLPEESDLLASVDHLFEQVPDKDKVTVTEIYQSLEAEFDCTLTKKLKKKVRERLKDLVVQFLSSNQSDDDDASSEEEEEPMSESEDDQESDAGSEYEQEDDEEAVKKTRKRSPKSKKGTKSSPKGKKNVKKRSPPKRKASQAMKKKLSAVRKQAEQVRKRRMEELRVRNEEMQAMEQDESRAERIAAKLDTNTDEHLKRRLEQRVELVEKLAQKRIAVIQANGEKHVELDDDSESSSDESEVEIVGGPSAKVKPLFDVQQRNHALGLLDLADRGARLPRKPLKKSSNSPMMAGRAALTARLRTQQRHMGNWWLARELNYSSVKEHVKDCKTVEEQKRLQTLQLEQERIEFCNKQLRNRLERGNMMDEDEEEELELEDRDKKEGDSSEEEDEEALMAKELEDLQPSANGEAMDNQGSDIQIPDDLDNDDHSSTLNKPQDEIKQSTKVSFAPGATETTEDKPSSFEDKSSPTGGQSEANAVENDNDESEEESFLETQPPMNIPKNMNDAIDSHETVARENDASVEVQPKNALERQPSSDENMLDTQPKDITAPTVSAEENKEADSMNADPTPESAEVQKDIEAEQKRSGRRNEGWKAMLRADAERAKKEKRRKASNGGFVEEEADEEEEDQIAGLEDFGFKVKRKAAEDDDEEDDDGIRKDDLEGVVDDLSDDEGDEQAGEEARKAMEAKEEKERQKDVMRLMREGYDGRRGGIGSGMGARGVHRFDQLTAADNREEAKRNGLLNEDEMDSDNESGDEVGKKGDDEEEDETALLDKILKDRHLHRTSIQENFSDDEEEITEDDPSKVSISKEDKEEREQERLAKRFAKRARMQRLLVLHGEEEEFSQARLIDEDASLRLELQNMKNGLVRKRSHSSAMGNSQLSSSANSRSASQPAPSFFGNSRNTSTASNSSGSSSNLFTGTGSALGLALQASRRSKPRLLSSWKSSDAAVFRTSRVSQPLLGGFSSSRSASNSGISAKKTGVSSSSSLWANAVENKKK